MQWVYDELIALRPQEAPGQVTNRTTRGFVTIPTARRLSGLGLSIFRLKSHQDNYITCRAASINTGTGVITDGPTDVFIAKPYKLRYSIAQETIRGVVTAYSAYDTAQQSRVATPAGGSAETEYITPDYLVNDLIIAATGPTFVKKLPADTTYLTLLDMNPDSRMWCVR